MSEILEKYKLIFTYDKSKTTVSSVSPLLSYYINNASFTQAKELHNGLKHILQYQKSKNRDVILTKDFTVKITAEEKAQIIYHDLEDTGKFVETIFTTPVEDLLYILQSWMKFLTPYKIRQVEIKNGQNIININSDGFITALVIEKPVAAVWPDCAGSIGEYYAVSSEKYDRQQELTANLTQALTTGLDEEIFAAIAVFLDLFMNGTYEITIGAVGIDSAEMAYDVPTTYADVVKEDERFTYGFYHYGYGETLLFSRSIETIDKNRIKEYIEIIKNGGRPKIILFTDPTIDHSYVIDGHHKLLAYKELRINAPAVIINTVDAGQQLRENITLQLFEILKPIEITHILEHHLIANLGFYIIPEITGYLDKMLRTQKSIGTTIPLLLFNTYHSADENYKDWAKQRLLVLGGNKYQGNGQILYYKTIDSEKKYTTMQSLFIESYKDFNLWKKIFLEGEKIPDDLRKQQKEISERYYPPYRPPQRNFVHPETYGRQTIPISKVNRSPWKLIVNIVLMGTLLLFLLKSCQ